jgi:hypothetical protein
MIFLRSTFFFVFELFDSPLPSLTDRKVQTVKDLEKPWAALITPQDSAPSSSPPQQPRTGHSAATTILLDDSHAKAARQPHNHLCVPEYTRERRNLDLVALQHEREQEAQAAAAAAATAHEAEAEELDAPSSPSAQLEAQDGNNEGEKRAKRKRKKEKKKQQQQRPASSTAAAHDDADAPASSSFFDETLLAVVGILHAARLQSSIAGWVRAGALLSGRGEVWCDDPALVHAWALRGREAMQELQLDVEHGVIPDP